MEMQPYDRQSPIRPLGGVKGLQHGRSSDCDSPLRGSLSESFAHSRICEVHTMKSFAVCLVLLSAWAGTSHAAEVYGGVGTTGVDLGVSQEISESVGARLDYNTFGLSRSFSSGDLNYDAKLKASNAGVYLDYFVSGGFRLTGGALVGNRSMTGVARSSGGTFTLNGVVYPVAASDSLSFEAKFPTVSPYLGIGYGHNRDVSGFGLYADLGVAFGRPTVQLSPSASLASKVSAADLAAEQSSAQDQANAFRIYPVAKVGVTYRF